QGRVLEDDDPPDQVEAGVVHCGRRLIGVVERSCRADCCSELRGAPYEAYLAVLVLHVQLERVQPVRAQGDVLVELARDGGETHRHVDSTELTRRRSF